MDEIEDLDRVVYEGELTKDTSGEVDEEEEQTGSAEKEAVPETHEHSDDAIKLYLKEIQATKLLTAQEERELAQRISLGDSMWPR